MTGRLSLVALAALAALALAAPAARAQATADDSLRAAVDRVFARWSGNDGPGCAAAVSRGGRTVYARGHGLADLEHDVPITPASIFHVASVSKQFTAMAVMLLAREGRLSLDDDIRKYVPEVPDFGPGKTITLRHLLTHTSGLRDQWDLLYFARGRFEEDRVTEADVLEIVGRQKSLNFTPGTEYLYSNTGFTLLGTVVRRVTDRSLRDFAEERIFRPLGMTQTHFHDDYTMVVKGRTSAYAMGPDRQWHVSIPNYDTYGATSLFTTVGDLLKWEENFEHPVVGDTAILRAMQTSAVLAGGDSTGYGFGLAVDRYRGALLVDHSGADAGYRSFVGRFPEHGLAIAIACNAAPANPVLMARGIADIHLASVLRPRDPAELAGGPRPVALSRDQLASRAGVYAHPVTGAPVWLTQRDTILTVGRPDGTGPRLVPLDERRFRVAGQGVELVFLPNGDAVQAAVGGPSHRVDTLQRRVPAHQSRAEMQRYTGRYRSEELGATYTVSATDSTLSLRTRMGEPLVVRPAFDDTFSGAALVEFTRDRRGQLTGMLLSSNRVRRVRFERER